MSLFRRVLNLDQPASPDLPVQPDAPLPTLTAESLEGETSSVRMIGAALSGLPPARARYVAAFAYLLGRAAYANMEVSDAERREMSGSARSPGSTPRRPSSSSTCARPCPPSSGRPRTSS